MAMTFNGTTGITYPDASLQATGNGLAKAWVNFNGTGTIAIRQDFNVSSLVDNGVGDYTVNFTTALADTLFATTGSTGRGSANTRGTCFEQHPTTANTTTSVTVRAITVDTSPAPMDPTTVSVAVFR